MRAIGIDIGTTTICGIVIDGVTGEVLDSKTLPNDSGLVGGPDFERAQDPERIFSKVKQIVSEFIERYSPIDSIGTTGQMHGMLYLDRNGNPVSPLYTWQDARGDEPDPGTGTSFAQELSALTGIWMATGFGLTTHFYNMRHGLVPANAVKMTTIGDYAGMKLCHETTPAISTGNGASWGCFDIRHGTFAVSAIEKAGIDPAILPEVKHSAHALIGRTPEGIPVSVSMGDNQASVIGSVRDLTSSVLVNVGTGSQVSFGVDHYIAASGGVELRPVTDDAYILAGSSLCGGRAYAMLEHFFRDVVRMAGVPDCGSLYGRMAEELSKNPPYPDTIRIATQFAGTRSDPVKRGAVTNINIHNFTPSDFIMGMMKGVSGELHDMYRSMCKLNGSEGTSLIGSGNGIRMNPILQGIFEDMFGMKLSIPAHTEEASFGTALFSLTAAGLYETLGEAQKIIRYV